MWTDLSSVLSQYTRVTDRQTDGQTDRQTDRILIAIPRLHYMQRGKNRSRNATVRVLADGQTHRHTDRHTDANRFYNLPMLYAIAMRQIKHDVSEKRKVNESCKM